MPTWNPDDDLYAVKHEQAVPDVTIRHQVAALLGGAWPRWLSPFEISVSLVARSAPRRLRELMEEDRRRPPLERKFEEREVDNNRGGRHKVYRALVINKAPTLF